MQKKLFSNDIYNKIPCALAAFKNNSTLDLVYANEYYYSKFSDGTANTLNIHADDKQLVIDFMKKYDAVHGSAVNYRCVNREGKTCYICMTVIEFEDGILLGALWDTTQQHNLLNHLQSEQEKYAIVLKFSKNIIFENNVYDNSLILYIPSHETNKINQIKITKGKDTIIKRSIWRTDRKFFMANMYNEKEESLSARMKVNNSKTWRWYRIHRKFEYDSDGKLIRVFGVLCDIQNEKEHEREIQKRLELDPELNVYNRNAGVDKTNEYLRKNFQRRDYALLVMDIDNFKNINDTFGHLYGDAVISTAAGTLKKCIGKDDIVARYGGDEFFVFVQQKTDEEIYMIADEILKNISRFHMTDVQTLSCSIGIALGTSFKDRPDYRALFEKADRALYYVKKHGKANWEIYNEEKMSDSTGHAIGYEKEELNNTELLETKDVMQAFLEASSGSKTSDEAIYRIIHYIVNKFNFDWLQIMLVNCEDDLITIIYEYCKDPNFRNNAGRSGYYIHSDIMKFRSHFETNPIFNVSIENTSNFSTKFQREFAKNMRYSVLYNANLTTENCFYMFVCTRFDKSNLWSDKDAEMLNEATKILTMYVSQSDRETERERSLQNAVSYDKTGLYTMAKFYIQIGRLRTLAVDRNECVVLLHTDFENFLEFNIKFGTTEGDNLLKEFSQFIDGNEFPDRAITAHIGGTDIFISALRINPAEREFIKKIEDRNKKFCDIQNKKYPGANIMLKTGIYFLKPGDEGGEGINYAIAAKKAVKDFTESFCVIYDDECLKKLL